ncbi:hypothetical protein TSUD_45430 [Trifolium subterraneum]|nr:hypothetical protein TSUD_45430 [Trifolium subterraneum]
MSFMEKVLHSSGQSEQTYLPPSLHFIPPKTHHLESIKELHMVIFPIMEDLFAKTKISPFDIDILIFNCSGFCPSPSLTSIVVNKYAMRNDIKTYNVSGMGCSASALCIDLAQNLLRVHKNSNAIVLSTEILSNGWYSAIREEDSDGKLGVTLKRDLLNVAGRGVIREVGKGLKLGEREIEAALMTLHRFGNQSSSSLWYELAYLEAKERVKKGDNIWQLGMGSGPKCCSVVLKCIRPILVIVDPKPSKESKIDVKSNKQPKIYKKLSNVDEKSIKEHKDDVQPSKEPMIVESAIDFCVQLTTMGSYSFKIYGHIYYYGVDGE